MTDRVFENATSWHTYEEWGGVEIFEDRKRVVDMWRRNGIWVFDCNQSGEEF